MAIRVLSPEVAAKIAAGEVIERPVSIVKELIENALDAGARRITVEIEGGGLDLIRVGDDGHGIAPAELPLAFLRHATSKLHGPEDLAAVRTLGFRGEALPSIAAAAEVELASRPAELDAGGRIRLSAGNVIEQTAYGGARGTVVTIRDLFVRQPARRKFLRAPAAEGAQIATIAGHYAIAYPEVAFSLRADGRRGLSTSGNGIRRDAVSRIYGAETAAALLELQPDAALAGEPVASGLVSPPSLTRANRSYMTLFVNRRWILPRRLLYAVEEAYESLLMTGRHPLVVIDLSLPPADLDVNVHPAKSEVRFLRERQVYGAINRAVRAALSGFALVPRYAEFPAPAAPRNGTPLPLWQTLTALDGHDRPPASPPPALARPALPILRVVGQTGGVYVVAEGPDGMYLVDQHAAHERVLYEQVLREREGRGIDSQGLLTPATIEVTPAQDVVVVANEDALREHGFELEPFGARCYLLRTVPALLGANDPARALTELLDEIGEAGEPAERRTRVAMTVACHAAVRAGKTLGLEEMRELLRLLEACEMPRTCPHGRPTMVHLSVAALEREFRRR